MSQIKFFFDQFSDNSPSQESLESFDFDDVEGEKEEQQQQQHQQKHYDEVRRHQQNEQRKPPQHLVKIFWQRSTN